MKYRVIVYVANGQGSEGLTLSSGTTTRERANEVLDQLEATGVITGGHIENYLKGIGWILAH
jgi:hypothetical protein